MNGVPLPIRSYVFENNGMPLHVYYCYWDGTVPNAATMNQENWTASGRLRAVREGSAKSVRKCSKSWRGVTIMNQIAEEAVRNQLENIIRRG